MIESKSDAGLPEGQLVDVPVSPSLRRDDPGDGIQRSFGGWDDDPEGLDEFLEWNRQQRMSGRPEIDG